jgi:hypothetical protein
MTTSSTPTNDQKTAEEMARVESEPLLPVEKQLIAGSLLLGLLLLGLLWWVSESYFPNAPEKGDSKNVEAVLK